MKAFFAAQGARLMLWLIRQGMGWIKSETPEHAMWARRVSKNKILKQKLKASGTKTKADDIAPLAGYVYMGFDTMRRAQHMLGEAMNELDPEIKQDHIIQAIRILDELE